MKSARTPPKPPARWIGLASLAAVAVCAFVFGFHKIDDFDTWWHLAAGRWIVVHHAIPTVDTLSHTVRDHAWINLQWGFDVALYGLQAAGGPVLLCLAGAIVFLAVALLIMRVVALRVGTGLASLIALLVVITAQERVTLRPELVSLLLLAGVLYVLDRAKRSDGRWAIVLVPVMMVWVNVHALFVIGVFAIGCALIGTLRRPTRLETLCAAAATLAVFINPFGISGVAFPVKLLSRINGSNDVFKTIGEFGSPFAAGAGGVSVVFYKLLLAAWSMAVIAALIASLGSRRSRPDAFPRFDWGGLLLFAGLAILSAAARRNIALFAVGTAPFVASCIEILLAAFPRSKQIAARRLRYAPLGVCVAALLVAASVAAGAFYRFDNSPQEFGAGIIEGTFPVRAAAFAKAAALPPTLYNDMASGGYLAWEDPLGTGVFVDGRLEVYDDQFLTDYVVGQGNSARFESLADRHQVQTAIIFHRFEPDRILAGRLVQEKRWSLVYVDEVAAVLVRTAGNDDALIRAAAIRGEWDARTEAWLARPVERTGYAAGRTEATRAYARFLATIGRAEPAISAYLKLLELGVPPKEEVERRLLLARYFASRGQLPQAQEHARRILEIDETNEDARTLLARVR